MFTQKEFIYPSKKILYYTLMDKMIFRFFAVRAMTFTKQVFQDIVLPINK